MEETNSLVELEQLRNEEYEKQFFGESIDKMKTKCKFYFINVLL